MHNIDWLHSPALPATMTRLILKYERLVAIMEDATNMTLPTLDVDLAWHTHQLNPPSYFKYVVTKARQFVDHGHCGGGMTGRESCVRISYALEHWVDDLSLQIVLVGRRSAPAVGVVTVAVAVVVVEAANMVFRSFGRSCLMNIGW